MSKSIFKAIQSMIPYCYQFPLNYMVPLYHCVSDEKLRHLLHIINYKNIKDFEKDLDEMSKKFEFVEWESFKTKYQIKNKKPYALLTFDDGLMEFKEIVAPILIRKGIYAINFINPAFAKNSDLMFRMKASLLIDCIIDKKNSVPPSLFKLLKVQSQSKKEVIAKLKTIGYNKKSLLDKVAELMDYDFENYLKQHKIYMNEQDLSKIHHQGFGISAHSWDHPYYHDLSVDEQLKNSINSTKFIKEKGFLDEAFAFPFSDFGIKKRFFERLFKEEKNLVFSFGTAGIKEDCVTKNLQRIPMENGFSAKDELNFECNYFQIKKFFNKNKIDRL